MASLTYDSSEARTGTGGITSYTHVSTWYESTHIPEAHQKVFGNMGISNFKKGTRQKTHAEQQKLINRERWNAFSYLLLGNRGTNLLIWGERTMEQIPASPRRLSLVTLLLTPTPCTLDEVWRDMSIQMQVKSTPRMLIRNWGLTPCCLKKNMYKPSWIFVYFVTIQWALDIPSCLV